MDQYSGNSRAYSRDCVGFEVLLAAPREANRAPTQEAVAKAALAISAQDLTSLVCAIVTILFAGLLLDAPATQIVQQMKLVVVHRRSTFVVLQFVSNTVVAYRLTLQRRDRYLKDRYRILAVWLHHW
jgi:hypothetical protein